MSWGRKLKRRDSRKKQKPPVGIKTRNEIIKTKQINDRIEYQFIRNLLRFYRY